MSLAQRFGAVGILAILLAAPLIVSAQTDPRIVDLLARVRELQAQLAALRGAPTILPPPSTSCANINANMHVRSTDAATGGDVTTLQNYLIENGYMVGLATGYFGLLTADAVGKLQLSLGIATSLTDPNYGYMGPRTRGAIACSGRGALSAIPSSGKAPLTVTFNANVASSYFGGANINFGDGTPEQQACPPGGTCTGVTLTHTYSPTGTGSYKASLVGVGQNSSTLLGTAFIVITSSSSTAPWAIIDPRSLVSTLENPTISGTAQNTHNDLVSFSLSNTAGNSIYDSGALDAISGKWSGKVGVDLAPGSYTVKVLDGDNKGPGTVLTTGTLTISGATTEYSPRGSSITPVSGGTLVTVDGTWSFSTTTDMFGNIILLNGIRAGNGSGVELLVSQLGKMFTRNVYNMWYQWTGGYPGWTLTSDPRVGSITVTAPNGGEQWEEGVLNTVTWKPYDPNFGINPSKNVTAYLEKKQTLCQSGTNICKDTYTTLGKVQESGKASIHWITGELDSATRGGNYAAVGTNYFIRVVNNTTGAWDRSDAPFSLLAKPIDLKVNGSDGPVTVAGTDPMAAISWKSGLNVTGCQLSGLTDVLYSTIQPNSGLLFAHISTGSYGNGTVGLYCVKNGAQITDYVSAISSSVAQPKAALTVTSPNGGEKIDPSKEMAVQFSSKGISSASVALYKNDQWKYWIDKDVLPSAKDLDLVNIYWTPSVALQGLGEGDNAGAIFKIYVTGQKADGTGYIDDKSDAPFEFVKSSTPTITATITASPTTCSIPQGATTCSSSISWAAPSTQVVQVWVATAGETKTLFSCTAGSSSANAPWITTAKATFSIYRTSSCATSEITGKTADATVAVMGAISTLSPDGTSITPTSGGSLTTKDGTWTFSSATSFGGNSILLNGKQAGSGSGVELLVSQGGKMFTRNSYNMWYQWTDSGWTQTSKPSNI